MEAVGCINELFKYIAIRMFVLYIITFKALADQQARYLQ